MCLGMLGWKRLLLFYGSTIIGQVWLRIVFVWLLIVLVANVPRANPYLYHWNLSLNMKHHSSVGPLITYLLCHSPPPDTTTCYFALTHFQNGSNCCLWEQNLLKKLLKYWDTTLLHVLECLRNYAWIEERSSLEQLLHFVIIWGYNGTRSLCRIHKLTDRRNDTWVLLNRLWRRCFRRMRFTTRIGINI